MGMSQVLSDRIPVKISFLCFSVKSRKKTKKINGCYFYSFKGQLDKIVDEKLKHDFILIFLVTSVQEKQ